MIKEKADALVSALRSGKYQQAAGRLQKESGFCCLGVACDISGLGEWRFFPSPAYPIYACPTLLDHEIDRSGEFSGYFAGEVLPFAVQQAFGFADTSGDFSDTIGMIESDGKQCSSLAELNDSGWTFAQIADFIEQNWERL